MGIHESLLAVASHKSLSAVSIHKFAIRGVNLQVAICDHKLLSVITSRYPWCQSASRSPRLQVAIRGVNLMVGGADLAIGVT